MRLEPSVQEWAEHRHPVSQLLRVEMDKASSERIGAEYGFVKDPDQEARLDGLVDRLQVASPFPNDPIRVVIVDDPRTRQEGKQGLENNVTASGNTIYVGKEYLAHKPSDDELLFVLGHEMGHIHHDHVGRRVNPLLADKAGEWAKEAVSPDQTTLSPHQREWVKSQARKAEWMGGFVQAQESEADRDAAILALSAGAKPQGIRDAFVWMKGEEAPLARLPKAEQKRIELTRDHPEPEERFESLRKVYGKALGDPLGAAP